MLEFYAEDCGPSSWAGGGSNESGACRSATPPPRWASPTARTVSTCKPLLLRKGLLGALGSTQGSGDVLQGGRKLHMIEQPCMEADGFHRGAYK